MRSQRSRAGTHRSRCQPDPNLVSLYKAVETVAATIDKSPRTRDMFVVAQAQHWQALQAIEQREGSRAEGVMREHSRIAQTNLRDAVSGQSHGALPGVQLIRRR